MMILGQLIDGHDGGGSADESMQGCELDLDEGDFRGVSYVLLPYSTKLTHLQDTELVSDLSLMYLQPNEK